MKNINYFLVVWTGSEEGYAQTILDIFTEYNKKNNLQIINLKIPNAFIIKDEKQNFTEQELCSEYRNLFINQQPGALIKIIASNDILVKQISDSTCLF